MALLQINGLIEESIVDGPGLRFVIFTQGCPHHCLGCHNPQTHNLKGGTYMDTDMLLQKIDKNPLLDGVTFSGGEPFLQAKALAYLAEKLHRRGLSVMTYTGYTLEALKSQRDTDVDQLLLQTDTLVDGPFILEKRNTTLPFRGSENQRIIALRH